MAWRHDDRSDARLLAGLNALAIDLAAADLDPDPVPLAIERLRTLTGAIVASYSEYDQPARVLRLRHTAADDAILDPREPDPRPRARQPRDAGDAGDAPRDDAAAASRRLPDLTALTLGAIPRPLGSTLEHVFGVGEKLVLDLPAWRAAVRAPPAC